MIKNLNPYNILQIKCDKDGLPIEEVSDEIVKGKYIEVLRKFINNLELSHKKNNNLNSENKQKMQKMTDKTFENALEKNKKKETEKTSDELQLLELILQSTEAFKANAKNLEFFAYYKNAYEMIKTEQLRKQYEQHIYMENHKKIKPILDNYKEPIMEKIEERKISYGDLMQNQKNSQLIFFNKWIRIFSDNEYQCIKITEGEEINPVKSRGNLELKKIVKYTLMIEDPETERWVADQFYGGKEIENKLNNIESEKFDEKERYVKQILTCRKKQIDEKRMYLGDLTLSENPTECIIDFNLEKKVEELEKRRKIEIKHEYDKMMENKKYEGEQL